MVNDGRMSLRINGPHRQLKIKLIEPGSSVLERFVEANYSLSDDPPSWLIWNSRRGTFSVDTTFDEATSIVQILATDSFEPQVTNQVYNLNVAEITDE